MQTAISYGKEAIDQARDFVADVGGIDTARRLIDIIEQEQVKAPVIVKPSAPKPEAKPSPKPSATLSWTFDVDSFDWVCGEHRLADINGKIILRGTDKTFPSFAAGKAYVATLGEDDNTPKPPKGGRKPKTAKTETPSQQQQLLAEIAKIKAENAALAKTTPETKPTKTQGTPVPTPKQPTTPKPAPKTLPADKPIRVTQPTVGQETQGQAVPTRKHATGKGQVESEEIINLIFRAREYGQVDVAAQLRHVLDVFEPGLGERLAA